jgi:hypothetical protein
LRQVYWQLWNEWTKKQKDGLKRERYLTKKRYGPTPTTIFAFFGSFVPYNKNDPL